MQMLSHLWGLPVFAVEFNNYIRSVRDIQSSNF
jgi:hypothetical protein